MGVTSARVLLGGKRKEGYIEQDGRSSELDISRGDGAHGGG